MKENLYFREIISGKRDF